MVTVAAFKDYYMYFYQALSYVCGFLFLFNMDFNP